MLVSFQILACWKDFGVMSIETLLSIYAASLSISFLVLITVLITIRRELSDLARYMNEIFIEFRFLNSRSSRFENRFLSLFEKFPAVPPKINRRVKMRLFQARERMRGHHVFDLGEQSSSRIF